MPRAAAERYVVYVTREEITLNAFTDMAFFSGLCTLHRPGRTFITPNEELAFCRKWEAKYGSPWQPVAVCARRGAPHAARHGHALPSQPGPAGSVSRGPHRDPHSPRYEKSRAI